MKHAIPAAFVAALTFFPTAATAQTTPSGAQPKGPSVNLWYIGATTGVAVVDHASAVAGGEVGFRVWKNLDLVGEITWMQDVVTRATLDKANTIAQSIQAAQGQPATSDVEVPALYGGVGARWVFEQVNRVKPYVITTFGGGHTERKPTFTLGGTDITNSLPTYGVTLGSDLIGKANDFTVSSGVGILMTFGSWYTDFGYRLTSIGTADQRTNVQRLLVGGGYRF
ncbi:MAG TPA: outer membrane beta-barrel protein [Vicinamibacterales bacterium]|nr:outer membrane beta-barrel protein [Vicinamibacterales bacterium]